MIEYSIGTISGSEGLVTNMSLIKILYLSKISS
jgi:hypothetical protein